MKPFGRVFGLATPAMAKPTHMGDRRGAGAVARQDATARGEPIRTQQQKAIDTVAASSA